MFIGRVSTTSPCLFDIGTWTMTGIVWTKICVCVFVVNNLVVNSGFVGSHKPSSIAPTNNESSNNSLIALEAEAWIQMIEDFIDSYHEAVQKVSLLRFQTVTHLICMFKWHKCLLPYIYRKRNY